MLIFRAFFTLIIFAVIFWFLPFKEVWQEMIRIGWWRWLLVVVVFASGHVISAYKWCQLIRATQSHLPFGEALRAHMAGLFANIWLPSIVGGDVVRAAWISRGLGLTVPAVIGLLDRVLDLLALMTLVVVGLLLVDGAEGSLAISVLRGTTLAMAVVGGALILVVFGLDKERLPVVLRPHFAKLADIGKTLYSRPGPALISFCLAVVVQLVFVGLNWFLGSALGIDVSFAVWLIAWPLAKIIALLPVSLGGLGVREASLAALLAPFSVAGTLAIAQGLVWQSVLFGFGLCAGIWTLLKGRESKGELFGG